GGSLGAAAINDLIPGVLARFPEQTRPDVWHQTGKRNFEVAQAAYRARGISMAISGEDGVRVAPFIDDMAAAYGWADYAVCRAGALTVSELAAAGLGALLVPYPHAIDDHQTINGEWLVAAGAATLIQQSDLREDVLFEHLNAVFADSPALIERATKARAVGKTDAAEVLANICDEVAHV
ncbi:MAG: UDP-N-acetylglucosamine--N-acetylmuramyl-(pentapeptide) pyrophosphoryl-undecaprenol N-acetylglucosamine transferase, partial [bacterium]